jgi:ABC-2 type transport system permease protein
MLYLSIAACFLAGDVVASEFEHKTCFIGFTNPVRRSTLLLGKYLACLVVFVGALSAYFSVSSVVVYSLFGGVPFQIVLAYLYSLIAGSAMLGVVFVFSASMKGSSATISSLLLLTFSFQLLPILMVMWEVEPWFILNYAAMIINAAIQPFPGGPDAFVSVVVFVVYVAASLGASVLVLDRKEFS